MAIKHLGSLSEQLRADIVELVVRRIKDLGFSGMELSMKLLAEVGDARHEECVEEFIRDLDRGGKPDCAHEGYHAPRRIEARKEHGATPLRPASAAAALRLKV